ncbi:MAG: site-2 protease family protein [Bacteroidota bacterium]
MKNSLELGRPFGIKLGIHWTFILLIAWVVAVDLMRGRTLAETLITILFVLVLFVCVVMHEYGHALVAKKYGYPTKSITLLPIGGMANITKMPEKPKQELLITGAGLAVNIVIAAALWGIISTTGGMSVQNLSFEAITWNNFLVLLMAVNILLVIFNLIPAFPMDGGRLLRAILSFRMNREKATKIAMLSGQAFGVIFVFGGIFVNPFLVIIGIFVFIGARMEYEEVRSKSVLEGYTVYDALMKKYTKLNPGEKLKNAVDVMLDTHEESFLVAENDKILGLLTKKDIIKGLSEYGESGEIDRVMRTTFESLRPDMPLLQAFEILKRNKSEVLPVFKDNHLEGVLDMDNVQEFMQVKSAIKEHK